MLGKLPAVSRPRLGNSCRCNTRTSMNSRAAAASALRRLARGVQSTFSGGSNGPPSSLPLSSPTDLTTTTSTTATTPMLRRCHRFASLVARSSSCCGDEENNDDVIAKMKHHHHHQLQQQRMLIHSSAEAATLSHLPPPPPTRTSSTSTASSSSSSSSSFSTDPSSASSLLHDPIAIPLHPCHQATSSRSSPSPPPSSSFAAGAASAAASAAAGTSTAQADAPPCDAPVSTVEEPKTNTSTSTSTSTTTPKVAPVVQWQDGGVPLEAKERLLNQRACVVWLTGLPASGKSAVAAAVERQLTSRGRAVALLDGDNVRHGLCADLGFSPEDRAENVRRVGEAARLLSTGGGGLVAVAALVSPYASHRDAVRASLPRGRFIEVFVDNPLGLCEERDPKGLYRAARRGQIKGMTGLDAPYEVPQRPEVTVSPCNATGGPEAAAAEVVRFLEKEGLIPPI